MRRWLDHTFTVPGGTLPGDCDDSDDPDPTAFLATDPGQWLPPPARRSGLDQWVITLTAGPPGTSGPSRPVLCRLGPIWRDGAARWRTISWEPRARRSDPVEVQRLLPAFRGELGAEPEGDDGGNGGGDGNDTVRLVLRGVYSPPGGWIGAAADHFGLHRVAGWTVDAFLQSVATAATGRDAAALNGANAAVPPTR